MLERFRNPTLNGWDVIGQHIVYASPRSGKLQVIAYNPETDDPSKGSATLIELPLAARYELGFAEDLSSVLFTQMDRRASDIYQVRWSQL